MRESTIEKYLVKRVKELGGEVRKVKWIGRRGAPDRFVMLPITKTRTPTPLRIITHAIWIELKAPGEKAKPYQAREHERMRAMGQRIEVVDSIERVEEVLA
ncbi:VRR-NUC domain containing protein [uncultured Caudovirales phage]|uniref:VRR-NUC domain containing protein n=1 Tax=uncultured Caudovirales phage TaxID=2100421 RepID=A0A6J7WBN5_9CAUD|nr:VRR-NUC domain containing protein [uncultured Caudovirales phage]